MDKFKKAINQLNKPIIEKNKKAPKEASASEKYARVQAKPHNKPVKTTTAAGEAVEEIKTMPAKEPVSEPEIQKPADGEEKPVSEPENRMNESESVIEEGRAEPEGEMSEYEKELERQYYSVRSEGKLKSGKKEKKAKKERSKKRTEKKDGRKEENKPILDITLQPEEKGHGIRTFIIISLIALAVIGCFANYRLNNQLKPVFYQVKSNNVVDNVRIVAISDMHLKEFGPNNERLVNKVKSYHPDIIAIVGDMNIDKNPDYRKVLNICARLNNIAPLYYALGNHEFEAMLFENSQIYYDLEAAGIKVLNNEVETIEVGLSTVDVIGLTQGPDRFKKDAQKFFEKAMESDNFKLVLTHYPENFQGVLEEYPIDLAICGHAHGGQIRLPFIGGIYSSDQGFFPQLCDGYHEIENSKVIVSKGLGRSGLVPRINNPPEITIVDINWY